MGQNPSDFCDSTLLAVNFVGFNAAGQGDFYDGIPADCSAEDDLRFAFGDPDEPMLKAARKYLKSASCPAVPRAGPAPVETLQGLQAIVGAF